MIEAARFKRAAAPALSPADRTFYSGSKTSIAKFRPQRGAEGARTEEPSMSFLRLLCFFAAIVLIDLL
jgi:hypothetical protein